MDEILFLVFNLGDAPYKILRRCFHNNFVTHFFFKSAWAIGESMEI